MTPMHIRYSYIIYGIAPEVPEGHDFKSSVENLQDKPELWEKECPFTIPKRNKDIRVELVR